MLRDVPPLCLALALLPGLLACGEERRLEPPATIAFDAPEVLLPRDATETFGTASIRVVDGAALVVDMVGGTLTRVAPCAAPPCSATTLATGLAAPARVAPVDWDGDGHTDLVVALLGTVQTVQHSKGGVQLLKADGQGGFSAIPLLPGLARTSCAVPADLDADGTPELLVCEFGHTKGGLRLAVRQSDGTLALRTLIDAPGTNTAHVADVDGDGDLDVVAQISQETETVVLLRQGPGGSFGEEVVMQGADACWGMGDLQVTDVDGDGDVDLLVSNGDVFDAQCDTPAIRARHGVDLLRNDGQGRFSAPVRLLSAPTSYTLSVGDLDGDGDDDVLVGTFAPPGGAPPEPRASWLQLRRGAAPVRHPLPAAPTQPVAHAIADWDGDGIADLLFGSLPMAAPGAQAARLVWLRGRR